MQGIDRTWIACLIIGFIVIVVMFWSRFNMPTHTAKLEFFKKYAPRFATREREFRRARYCYISVVVAVYAALSVSPNIVAEILEGLRGVSFTKDFVEALVSTVGEPRALAPSPVFPLIVAAVLAFGGNMPGIARIEYSIRSFFHSLGKIPESVQATVKQLKSSTYDHRTCCDFTDPVRTKEVLGFPVVSEETIMTDEVLRTWCTVCCLTDRLARIDTGQVAIREAFLGAYGTELEEIIAQRDELRRIVADYAAAVASAGDDPAKMNGDLHALRSDVRNRVRNLRERLFVFIACGFRSSAATDAAVSSGLRDFGFGIQVQPVPDRKVADLLGAIVCYVIVMSFVAVLLADWFHAWMGTEKIGLAEAILMIPAQDGLQWLWTLTSGLFSLTAIVVAFTIRRARLNRHDWFNFDSPERRRPLLSRYTWTAFVSAFAGMVALFSVNFVMTFFYAPSEISGSFEMLFRVAVGGTYPWFPMALIVAFACQHVVDEDQLEVPAARRLALATAWSVAVAVVGLSLAYNLESARLKSTQPNLQAQATQLQQKIDSADAAQPIEELQKELILTKAQLARLPEELPVIGRAVPYAATLIGFLIFVQMLFVTLVLQTMERSAQLSGSLTDRWLSLRTSDGDEQEIVLQKGGALHSLDSVTGDKPRVGQWVHYPQCQVVHWETSLPLGAHKLRGIGLIERIGGVIIYTGLADGASGDFVAQGSFAERPQPVSAPPPRRLSVVGG